ncbi:hypothetical protein KIPB_008742 [Kipferlia bialata]|uniref:Uncharacterized protein n=1 Tax=Kipferlia bialata TaxID=797122 RepID=A0A9K3GL19_9EUKA|nr:hypothetical protein KIPB_008742 [Kipferlia bialata]|eukprot:g8742.t1
MWGGVWVDEKAYRGSTVPFDSQGVEGTAAVLLGTQGGVSSLSVRVCQEWQRRSSIVSTLTLLDPTTLILSISSDTHPGRGGVRVEMGSGEGMDGTDRIDAYTPHTLSVTLATLTHLYDPGFDTTDMHPISDRGGHKRDRPDIDIVIPIPHGQGIDIPHTPFTHPVSDPYLSLSLMPSFHDTFSMVMMEGGRLPRPDTWALMIRSEFPNGLPLSSRASLSTVSDSDSDTSTPTLPGLGGVSKADPSRHAVYPYPSLGCLPLSLSLFPGGTSTCISGQTPPQGAYSSSGLVYDDTRGERLGLGVPWDGQGLCHGCHSTLARVISNTVTGVARLHEQLHHGDVYYTLIQKGQSMHTLSHPILAIGGICLAAHSILSIVVGGRGTGGWRGGVSTLSHALTLSAGLTSAFASPHTLLDLYVYSCGVRLGLGLLALYRQSASLPPPPRVLRLCIIVCVGVCPCVLSTLSWGRAWVGMGGYAHAPMAVSIPLLGSAALTLSNALLYWMDDTVANRLA